MQLALPFFALLCLSLEHSARAPLRVMLIRMMSIGQFEPTPHCGRPGWAGPRFTVTLAIQAWRFYPVHFAHNIRVSRFPP